MKKTILLAVAIIISITITSCDAVKHITKQPTAYPVEVLNVTVNSKPQKIASLSPMLTQILIDMGYDQELIAVSNSCFQEGESEKTRIGTSTIPDYELIGEVAPEIIFTNTPIPASQMQKLADVNIKVVVVKAPKTIDELKKLYIDIVAIMSGNIESSTVATANMDEMSAQIQSIKTKIQNESVSFIYVDTLDPIIATGDTFESDVLSLFGENLAKDKVQYNVTPEEIKALNPQVIFFAKTLTADHIKTSDLFKHTQAVANEKLIVIDSNIFKRPTKSLPQKLTDIAAQLYPDIIFDNVTGLESESQDYLEGNEGKAE